MGSIEKHSIPPAFSLKYSAPSLPLLWALDYNWPQFLLTQLNI